MATATTTSLTWEKKEKGVLVAGNFELRLKSGYWSVWQNGTKIEGKGMSRLNKTEAMDFVAIKVNEDSQNDEQEENKDIGMGATCDEDGDKEVEGYEFGLDEELEWKELQTISSNEVGNVEDVLNFSQEGDLTMSKKNHREEESNTATATQAPPAPAPEEKKVDEIITWLAPVKEEVGMTIAHKWNSECKRYTVARVDGHEARYVVLENFPGKSPPDKIIVNDLKNLRAAFERAEDFHCRVLGVFSVNSNREAMVTEAAKEGLDKRAPKEENKPAEVLVVEIVRDEAIALFKALGAQIDFSQYSNKRLVTKINALKEGVAEYDVPADLEMLKLRDVILGELAIGNEAFLSNPDNEEESTIKFITKKQKGSRTSSKASSQQGGTSAEGDNKPRGKDRFGCLLGKKPARLNEHLTLEPQSAEVLGEKTGLTAGDVIYNLKWYADHWQYCKYDDQKRFSLNPDWTPNTPRK